VPIYQRPDSPVWYLDLRHPRGGRIRRSARTTDKEAAQRQHDELAARLWQVKQTGLQFSDALLAWATAKPRGESDIRQLKQIRAKYADRPLIDVTESSFIEVFGSKSPGTYNRLAAIARAALNIAHQREWIDRPPRGWRRSRYQTGESGRW